MSEYTVNLYFVGRDKDDALSSLPFTDLTNAEVYRDDHANSEVLSIFEAEVSFSLSTANVNRIDV